MTRSPRVVPAIVAAVLIVAGGPAWAQGVQVKAPRYTPGAEWTVIELDDPSGLPRFGKGWQRSTFWDLRPVSGGTEIRWTVDLPRHAGLEAPAEDTGADLTLCAVRTDDDTSIGCRLIASDRVGPTGPRALWSSLPGETSAGLRVLTSLKPEQVLIAGDRFTDRWLDGGDATKTIDGVALAEGIALTPAGPAEVVLLREVVSSRDTTQTRFRFVEENGRTVAVFETESGAPVRGSVLAEADRLADDGLTIGYEKLSASLTPGSIGFLQYSMSFTGVNCLADVDCSSANAICIGADPVAVPPVPGSCRAPLSDLRAGWTGIADAIGIDQTNLPYQPDPDDPTTAQNLPEVWEFATLNTANLQQRTFNTIRNDTGWNTCLETCAVRDVTATPPDGTWQAYLKIDNYDESGSFVTRDLFMFNDNDTGADPSIDVPFVVQDQANASDRSQICFEQSGGNSADRLLEFFQFTGPDPASAV
ncbi:MAG: hypothetical protein GTN89_04940, partial [Acidobacteria bacterium]|nr:hypothetical protein [Acidobacteriota bacterium]NIM60700.1 hypothetical protein [Acidobacteriota bacterium]NIO58660.1 hypothetical protein [Acidobacteriota bacterium]NIQ29716.1 hypothetical protein [Acidobacteriota bacterium]NIQ84433.1 hypothetical protein [Acidobacteriota bacterium]